MATCSDCGGRYNGEDCPFCANPVPVEEPTEEEAPSTEEDE